MAMAVAVAVTVAVMVDSTGPFRIAVSPDLPKVPRIKISYNGREMKMGRLTRLPPIDNYTSRKSTSALNNPNGNGGQKSNSNSNRNSSSNGNPQDVPIHSPSFGAQNNENMPFNVADFLGAGAGAGAGGGGSAGMGNGDLHSATRGRWGVATCPSRLFLCI